MAASPPIFTQSACAMYVCPSQECKQITQTTKQDKTVIFHRQIKAVRVSIKYKISTNFESISYI